MRNLSISLLFRRLNSEVKHDCFFRYLIISSITAVVLLGVILMTQQGCMGCRKEQTGVYTIVPGDSDLVVNVDMKNMLSDANFQKALVAKGQDIKDYPAVVKYMKKETGIEIPRLEQACAFVDFSEEKNGRSQGALILKGKFNKKQILDAANRKKKKKISIREFKGYSFIDISIITRICIIGNDYFVIGPHQSVDKVIGKFTGNKKPVNSELYSKSLLDSGDILRVAAVFPEKYRKNLDEKNREMKAIVSLSGKLNKSSGKYVMSFSLNCDDEISAKSLYQALESIISLGKNTKQKVLVELLAQVKTSFDGSNINISCDVPPGSISVLVPGNPFMKAPIPGI